MLKTTIKFLFIVVSLLLLTSCFDNTATTKTNRQPLKQHYETEVAITRKQKYKIQTLLNQSEKSLYWKLVRICRNSNYMIFPQVSLGEILKADYIGYKAIMCKRLDFCITDKEFNPIMAIEYNGPGHYNNTSKLRDNIKKQAVEATGIDFIVIDNNNKLEKLEYIRTLLNKKKAA